MTAHVSGPSRAEAVRPLGAADVLTEIGNDAGPFDFVFDGVGGPVLTAAVRRLAQCGHITSYGAASGQRSDIAFYDFAGAAPGGNLEGLFIYRTARRRLANICRCWLSSWRTGR